MVKKLLFLSNDDEPGKLARRRVTIDRSDLHAAGQPAVLATVDPPLTGGGWGNGTSTIILTSRIRGAPIDAIITDPAKVGGRVFVCRYLGDASKILTEVARDEISIEFWGLLQYS